MWRFSPLSVMLATRVADVRNGRRKLPIENVSNPAQNRPLQAVIINRRSFEIRGICSMTPAAYPWEDSSQATGRKQGTDGTNSSSVPPSAAQTASIPQRLVRKTAGDTHTTGPGSPIAKDVPVLRFDHAAPQNELHGVRQVPQSRLGSTQRRSASLMCGVVSRRWSVVNRLPGHSALGWGGRIP